MKEESEKLDRSIKTKTLIISDLTMRLTNEKAMNADVICGKIGHITHSINFNRNIMNYDNIVVVAGLNNIDNGMEDNKDRERQYSINQLKELGQPLKDQLNSNPDKKKYTS